MPPSRRQVLAALAGTSGVAGTTALAGCIGDGDPQQEPADPPEDLQAPFEVQGTPLAADFETTSVVENLDVPWDLAVGPDEIFVTERPGPVRRRSLDSLTDGEGIDADELDAEPIDLPDQAAPGEGGTLGVALHPDYPEPAFVYVYYTADVGDVINRVVRYDADDPDGVEVEIVVDEIPGARIHNGGRIAFGPDDHLYVLTGDAEDLDLPQDPGSLAGMVLRVTPDGEPVGADVGDGDPRVVTYGHRNLQGIDWLPDGTALLTEHGPRARDEVSRLVEGGNYGWPGTRGGPDDGEYDSYGDNAQFQPPVASSETVTTWAPSGATWYDGDAISELRNRYLFAGLRSQSLHVLTLLEPDSPVPEDAARVYDADWMDEEYLAVRHQLLVEEFGRLRHVAQGPDGSIYLLTSNEDGRISGRFPTDADDRIVRLDPA